jgi:flagellar basal body-associated protein FliL
MLARNGRPEKGFAWVLIIVLVVLALFGGFGYRRF